MAHLTLDITPELARQLQEEAVRRGLGVSAYVRLALKALVTPQNALPRDTTVSCSEDRSEPATGATVSDEILTMVETIWRDVPEEDLAKLHRLLRQPRSLSLWGAEEDMMRSVFADALYRVALAHRRDQWHQAAVAATRALGETQIMMTEEILVEFLNAFSSGAWLRRAVVAQVRRIRSSMHMEVIPQTPRLYLWFRVVCQTS